MSETNTQTKQVNAAKILAFIDEISPDFLKFVEASLFFRENAPQFHEGLKDLNIYEVYSLIRQKILDVFKRVFDVHTSEEDESEDLIFQIEYNCRTEEEKERLMAKLLELSPVSHKIMETTKSASIYRTRECYFYVDLQMDNPAYMYLLNEIGRVVEEFLINFEGKYSLNMQSSDLYFGLVEIEESRRASCLEDMLRLKSKWENKKME